MLKGQAAHDDPVSLVAGHELEALQRAV